MIEIFRIQYQKWDEDPDTGVWCTVSTTFAQEHADKLLDHLSETRPEFRWQWVASPFR